MDTKSKHVMAEFRGCDPNTLNNVKWIEGVMRRAAEAAFATVMQSSFHQFGPHGVSGVLVLAESHLSVHTWPERGYAAADIYTCGDRCKPERAHEVLRLALGATTCEVMVVERGLPGTNGMRLVDHQTYSAPETVDQRAQSGQRID